MTVVKEVVRMRGAVQVPALNRMSYEEIVFDREGA
jgi:hypothetical protein